MNAEGAAQKNHPVRAILLVVLSMSCISVNDMLIKLLSGDYPLHQMVFVRSAIGIVFTLAMLKAEGGFRLLRTDKPFLHLARGLLIVVSNMAFFAALAVIPLANATALFFVAPLFITLLSVPILGETVGPRRLGAVAVGFAGVLVMLSPWQTAADAADAGLILLLPLLSALTYALMQILTRRLGVTAKASAMAVYIHGTFILVGAGFWAVAGDGRYEGAVDHPSLQFFLRAWRWPEGGDLWPFLCIGLLGGIIGYALSQAYRSAPAATVAPFEYVAMPLSIMWGWLFWGEFPDAQAFAGIALIVCAGIYVFLREGKRRRPVASQRPIRRY